MKLTNLEKARGLQLRIALNTFHLPALKKRLENRDYINVNKMKEKISEMESEVKNGHAEIFKLSGVHKVERDNDDIVTFFKFRNEFEATWMTDSQSPIGRWKVIFGKRKPVWAGAIEKNRLASRIRGALTKAGFVQSKHPLAKCGFK